MRNLLGEFPERGSEKCPDARRGERPTHRSSGLFFRRFFDFFQHLFCVFVGGIEGQRFFIILLS